MNNNTLKYYIKPNVQSPRVKLIDKDKPQGTIDLAYYKANDYEDKDRQYAFCLIPAEGSEKKRIFICAGNSQEG